MCSLVLTSYQYVGGAVVVILAEDDEALSTQRMESVLDRDLGRENCGIMSPPRTAADNGRRRCIR